ncbi:Amt4 [Diaporthe helianthi]|uniref:Amt4 n=1 Tax=Diaporthe helianthi TaxID=158607 RepID=A0A2P5HPH1_DIAHE|nr:Amt4 [Diaporthe helianthi]
MEDDENPGLIYEAEDGPDPLRYSHIPLVLIHDGGGTCFSYYCLNPIGRIVYEIHNPHFYSAKPWPGGIPEMARHYVGLIRNSAVPRGRILLGGWSLGGLLSLEMARMLAGDPDFTVIGIVMMDSICPAATRTTRTAGPAVVPYKQRFGPNTKQETIEGVERCFAEAGRSIEAWTMPRWDGSDVDAAEGGEGQLRAHGPLTSSKCPPTILLRAREAVPTGPGQVSFVDTTRNSRSLGWDEYQKDFLEEVIDISGHHFSIFDWEYIDDVSQKLMEACDKLENKTAGTAA